MVRLQVIDHAPCRTADGALPAGCPGWCEHSCADPHWTRARTRRVAAIVPGTLVGGRFRLEQAIGKGGMGLVWRAWDVLGRERVAVKLLGEEFDRNPGIRGWFLVETRALGRVHHPNVVAIRGAGVHLGVPFLAMQWLPGHTLGDEFTAALPFERARALLAGVADGLAAVHAAGIVHNDVKPTNVLVVGARPILIDFGLARPWADVCRRDPTALVGTPNYMAPERIHDSAIAASPASDVYALGVVAYEAFTGAVPFDDPDLQRLLEQQCNDVAPSPSRVRPGLPPALDALLADALAKDPTARIGAAEFAARLRALPGPRAIWLGETRGEPPHGRVTLGYARAL